MKQTLEQELRSCLMHLGCEGKIRPDVADEIMNIVYKHKTYLHQYSDHDMSRLMEDPEFRHYAKRWAARELLLSSRELMEIIEFDEDEIPSTQQIRFKTHMTMYL